VLMNESPREAAKSKGFNRSISEMFSNSGCPFSSEPNLLEGGPFCASTCTPFSNHEDLKSTVDTLMVEAWAILGAFAAVQAPPHGM